MSNRITFVSCRAATQAAVEAFVREWREGTPQFTVHTSGSTGKPKAVVLQRRQLEASARRTLRFFDLQPGATALMAISPATIGGKMMIVRTLLGGLHLLVTEPSSDPLANVPTDTMIDFAPLVPLQLRTLAGSPARLQRIRTILLGGAPLDPALEQQVEQLHPRVFVGYGMTETISHVAIRQIGSPVYDALEGVTFGERNGALVITDRLLGIEDLQTSDSVRLHGPAQLEWLGRTDFAINSGGIKIHPEQVEQVLAAVLDSPFFVAGRPDATLGEQCILVTEEHATPPDLERIQALCAERLGKYAAPKAVVRVPFVYAAGGKINRKATLEQLTGA